MTIEQDKIEIEKNDSGHARLKINEAMTVFHAKTLKQALLASLADADVLTLNLSDVMEIDTAGLQILMLLKKEALKQQKSLSLSNHSLAVVDLLEISQLTGFFGDPVLPKNKTDKAQGAPA